MNRTSISRREFNAGVATGAIGFFTSEERSQPIDSALWSTVQGNAAHTGHCGTTNDRSVHGGAYWEVDVGGEMAASPVVADDAVFVATSDGDVAAFELADGTRRWKREGTTRIHQTPAVDSEAVYVSLNAGKLSALDVRTGTIRWETALDAELSENNGPVVVDETVYACDVTGYVYAIDTASGEIRWRVDPELVASAGKMAVSDGRVVIVSDLFIGALDAADGRRMWRTEIGSAIWGPPTIAGNVYVPLGPDSTVAAFSIENGDLKWAFTTIDESTSSKGGPPSPRSPIVKDETVIVADTAGTVLAAERADGSERWRRSITEQLVHHPVACGETVYLPTEEHLVALSMSTGEIRWRYRVGEKPTSPAFAGDRLLVSTTAGRLLALGRKRSFLERWGGLLGAGIGTGLVGLGGYTAYRALRNGR